MAVLEQALGLSVGERLQLVEALWDSLTSEARDIPVHNWQREELQRRLDVQRSDPQPGQRWEDVCQENRDGKA